MLAFLACSLAANFARGAAADDCPSATALPAAQPLEKTAASLLRAIVDSPDTVFSDLPSALAAQVKARKPNRFIDTGNAAFPKFPSYSACAKTFFRVATIGGEVDKKISAEGWKSGWVRREEDLKRWGQSTAHSNFDALPPTAPIADRVVQYVRVKNVRSPFPKDSTIVGVLADPIRTLSVGYHTGYDAGYRGDHMRMDEIEVGPCAKAPACKALKPVDTTAVFAAKKLVPRFSTEGEFALDMHVPKECVTATYRLKWQKVDDKCYSDVNNNCSFK